MTPIKEKPLRERMKGYAKQMTGTKTFTILDFIRPEVLHLALFIENELRNHDEVKGDSWRRCSIGYLRDKLREEFAEWSTANKSSELLDMGAIIMMLWYRRGEL